MDLEQAVMRAFGGAERVASLQKCLVALAVAGAGLAIVSRNSKHIILRALRAAGLDSHFHGRLVFGWEDYAETMPKSALITERIMAPAKLSEAEVIFIDDSAGNIRDVQRVCAVVHVANKGGMGETHMTELTSWAASQGPRVRLGSTGAEPQ
mmetsp:Transcript_12625/g.28242  ORF Transcript_12625/g.28242 Transcript_12625/m.28242 type:complete len:152 (+) Transcript_12625:328-783(+)